MATKQPSRRNRGPINAGSMADIAFLLLIFFLVTTTMDTDVGIKRILPAIEEDATPPTPTPERNIYTILVNDAGELLVRGEPMEVDALRLGAKEFMTNAGNRDDLPRKQLVTPDILKERIGEAEARLSTVGADKRVQLELSVLRLREKLAAVELIGAYHELPADAMIFLQTGSRTTYDKYLQVQNELEGAVRELRDELAQQKFGRKFTDLNEHDPLDRERIKAIRMVYPQRIREEGVVEIR